MIKRLIFDIDGTLVTGINFDKAITKTLLKYNIFSEENKQKFFDAMITYEDNYNEYEKNQYTQYFSKVLGYQFDNDFLDIHFKNLLTYAIPSAILYCWYVIPASSAISSAFLNRWIACWYLLLLQYPNAL